MCGPSTDKGIVGRTGKEKGLDISKEGDGNRDIEGWNKMMLFI